MTDDARVVGIPARQLEYALGLLASLRDETTPERGVTGALCRAIDDFIRTGEVPENVKLEGVLNGRSPGYDMEPEIQAQAAEYRAMQREAPSSHPAGTQATPQGDQRGTTPSPAGTGDSAPKMQHPGDPLDRTPLIEQMAKMLRDAPCPTPGCIDGSIQSTCPDPQDDACPWCYARHDLLSLVTYGLDDAPEERKPCPWCHLRSGHYPGCASNVAQQPNDRS